MTGKAAWFYREKMTLRKSHSYPNNVRTVQETGYNFGDVATLSFFFIQIFKPKKKKKYIILELIRISAEKYLQS